VDCTNSLTRKSGKWHANATLQFLAKSHVKKRAVDSHSDCSNYGCILCSVEGVAGMSDKTRQKVKCILGRVAADSEDFDLNVPIFSPVQDQRAE
jgi:hypothetical protein